MNIKQITLNKRFILNIIIVSFLFILFTIINSIVSRAEGTIFYVNPDKAYVTNTYATIEEAINQASNGDTIHIVNGTYLVSNLEITKSLTIRGESTDGVILIPSEDNASNDTGWIFIDKDLDVNIMNLTLDGRTTEHDLFIGIYSRSYIHVIDSTFKDISYGTNSGTALVLLNGGYVSDNVFTGIGEIGLQVMGGTELDSGILNNTFIGSGDENHLDYGIRIETEASAVIKGNTISGYLGKNSNSQSAGIVVSSLFGTNPTSVTITERNYITGNEVGILVGEGENDKNSQVVANGNIIKDNGQAILTNGSHVVNATGNFFDSGLERPTGIDEDVSYFPWAIDDTFEHFSNDSIKQLVIDDDFTNLSLYDHVSVDTDQDGTNEHYYFGYNAFSNLASAINQGDASSTLFVQPGRYELEETLIIDKGLQIIGTSVDDVTIDASQISTGIELTNSEELLLSNLSIVGQETSNTGLYIKQAAGVVLNNIDINGFLNSGLYADAATNIELTDIQVSYNGIGIKLTDTKNVTLNAISSANNNAGISIESTHDNYEGYDNIMMNSVSGVMDGINIIDQPRENMTVTRYSVNDQLADVMFNSENINYAYYGIKRDTDSHYVKFFNTENEALLMTKLIAFDHVFVSSLHTNEFIVTESLSINDAVNSSNDGDTIIIYPGTHTIDETLLINHRITIKGNGTDENPVILTYKGTEGQAVLIQSNDVTLDGFTLTTPNMTSHVIKAIGSVTDGTRIENLTIHNLSIKNGTSGQSGILLKGVNHSNVQNVSVSGSGQGAGVELVDSSHITIDYLATSGNNDGGILIKAVGTNFEGSSQSITLSNIDAINELKKVVVSDSANGIEALLLPNSLTQQVNGAGMIYYSDSLADAIRIGESLANTIADVTVKEVNKGTYYVSSGLSIQAAIDASEEGHLISLTEGTFTLKTPLTLNKGIHLRGAGQDLTIIQVEQDVEHAIMLGQTNIENIELSNFTLVASSTSGNGIYADRTKNLSIHDIQIKQFATGIYLDSSSYTTLGRIEAIENSTSGMTLVNPTAMNVNALTTRDNAVGVIIISNEIEGDSPIENVVFSTDVLIVDGILLQETAAPSVSYSLDQTENSDLTFLMDTYPVVYQGVTPEGVTETIFKNNKEDALSLTLQEGYTDTFVKDIKEDIYYINDELSLKTALYLADQYDTIYLTEGNYTLNETLRIDQELTLTGDGEDRVTIHSNVIEDEALLITSGSVTISNVTLNTPSILSNPIKVQSVSRDEGVRVTESITIQNVTVNNNKDGGKTGIYLNGIQDAIIENVTVNFSGNGNGITITDSKTVTLRNITTDGNLWGSIGLNAVGESFSGGTDSVLIEGELNLNELNTIYIHESNGYKVTNLTLPSSYHFIIDDSEKHFYQSSLELAFDFVNGYLEQDQNGLAEYLTLRSNKMNAFYVIKGLSIQNAVDQATNETIYIYPGVYNEATTISVNDTETKMVGLNLNKDHISLVGVNQDGTEIVHPTDASASIEINTPVDEQFLVTGNHVRIQGLNLIGYNELDESLMNYVVKVMGDDVTIKYNSIEINRGEILNSIYITDQTKTSVSEDAFISAISAYLIEHNHLYGAIQINEGVGVNVTEGTVMIDSNLFQDSDNGVTKTSGIVLGTESHTLSTRLPVVKNNSFMSTTAASFRSYRTLPTLDYIESLIANNQFNTYAYLLTNDEAIKELIINENHQIVIWRGKNETVPFMNVDDSIVFNMGDGEKKRIAGALYMPGYDGIPALLSDQNNMTLSVDPLFPDITGLSIFVKLNDQDFTPYTNGLQFEAEGMSEIIFKTVDSDSHEYLSNKLTIKIDQTPPILSGVRDLYVDVFSDEIDYMEGVWATDALSKTKLIQVDDRNVKLNEVGQFTITYSVSDDVGNKTEHTVTVYVEDHEAPTITKQGRVFEVGSVVSDWYDYFTIADNYDEKEDLVVEVDSSKVDFNTIGTYDVTITVTDQSENKTTESFTVTVQDTTAPLLSGDVTPYEVNTELPNWNDLFTISDNYNEAAELTIEVDDSTVDMSLVGTYVVTVKVRDTSGNETVETYDVVVQDTIAPVITTNNLEFVLGASVPTWKEFVTVSDNYDDALALTVDIDASAVEMSTVGNYDVLVTVTDTHGNYSEQTFKVMIIDDIGPIVIVENRMFEVLSDAPIWSVLIDATDNYDAVDNLEISINADDVKMDTVGVYTVYVTVTDASSNKTETSFEVTIVDTLAPVFNGVKDRTISVGDSDFDPLKDITAIDLNDGDLTEEIQVIGDYDLDEHGEYTLTLKVKDASGNEKTTTYTLMVDDPNRGLNPAVIIAIAVGSILIVGTAILVPKLGKKS